MMMLDKILNALILIPYLHPEDRHELNQLLPLIKFLFTPINGPAVERIDLQPLPVFLHSLKDIPPKVIQKILSSTISEVFQLATTPYSALLDIPYNTAKRVITAAKAFYELYAKQYIRTKF